MNELEQAIPKLQEALELKKIFYQNIKAPPEVAASYYLLADTLFQNKEHEKALPYFQEALEICETNKSVNLSSLNNGGVTLKISYKISL